MPSVYDLHCHSDQSDGVLAPEALVTRAKAQGVDCLALTDHDSVAGIAKAREQASIEGLSLISGIEFSSQWMGRGVHIVGLAIDAASDAITHAVSEQTRIRHARAVTIAERLQKAGLPDVLSGAKQLAEGGVIGRPHIARYLVDIGQVSTVNQAFKRYLGTGKIGDVKNVWPDMDTVVAWIRASGGIAVLAHPAKYKLTRTKLCELSADFTEAGGQAIEVVSGKQPVGLAENLAKIAQLFNLAGSCGSDFHVPGQAWQELGRFSAFPTGIQPVWELW